MGSKKVKETSKKNSGCKKTMAKSDAVSYRLKCARTANGLSHFVMYGDAPRKETLL